MTTYTITRPRYGDPYRVIATTDGKREVVAKFRNWLEAHDLCERMKEGKPKLWRD